MKLHLPKLLRSALLACMVYSGSVYGETETLTLPGSDDFTWIAGSNANGIGTGASAEIVQQLATVIGSENMVGWFGGTGQAYAQGSYPDDISITSSTSFSFTSRPALSGEYVALGVALENAADAITLSFNTDKKLGYSLWSYDGTAATELIGLTYVGAAGDVSVTYDTALVESPTLFVVWTANHSSGNAGGGQAVTVSDIGITYTVPNYYWEGTEATGNWSDGSWRADGDTSVLVQLPESSVNVVFNNDDEVEIAIKNTAIVNDMSVTAGNYTFTGAALEVKGTLTVGSDATANVETGLTVGDLRVEGTLGISQTITVENGTVTLVDGCTINLQNFKPTEVTTSFTDSSNGLGSETRTYEVFAGGSITGEIGTWQIDGTAAGGSFVMETGKYEVTVAGKIFGVGVGSVNSSAVGGAEGIALNGGTLVLDNEPTEGFITATKKGGMLVLQKDQEVNQAVLGSLEGKTTLKGEAGSNYNLGSDTVLAENLELSNDWAGTVIMSDITTPTEDFNITNLGRDGSSIKMGAVNVKKLTSNTEAAVKVDSLTLGGEESQVVGALTLTGNTLTLGSGDASLKAASLTTDSGDLTIAATSQEVLDALNTKASQDAVTILTLETGFKGKLTQNDIVVMTRAAAPAEKYYTELQWNADKTKLTYASQVNPDYVGKQVAATSQNGLAGVAMLQQALQQVNPQVTAPDGAMAAALNAVDAGELSEEGAAAVAGAATAVLGMAVSGDVDRQLQAIRNRTTTMGVDQSVANADMPYFNAWINAEGDRSELSESGTESGYELSSWGGTVGFDVDLCPTFTAGMALTAMYGDIDTTGSDKASGNIDTYYVTAFARYAPSAWTHTFVATVGMSDISLDRHVAGSEMEGETDGLSFGLMYEVGRVFALTEDGSTCLQPVFNVTWKHTAIDAYTEDGSDLALEVDEQTLDTVTFGLGARLQTVVGESIYNRTSILEARVLAKADVGDRSGSADVAFSAVPGAKASVDSAEMGVFGLEAGAGLSIPVGDEGGSIFMDASVELRSDYTNVNGTLGYRINF